LEGEQRVAQSGAHAERGHRLRRDLAVRRHEASDGAQAEPADDGQQHDDNRAREEDLLAQLHGRHTFTPRVSFSSRLRSADAPAKTAQQAKAARYASRGYARAPPSIAPLHRASRSAPSGACVSAAPRKPPRLTTATATPARCGGFTSRPIGQVNTKAALNIPTPRNRTNTPHSGSEPSVSTHTKERPTKPDVNIV